MKSSVRSFRFSKVYLLFCVPDDIKRPWDHFGYLKNSFHRNNLDRRQIEDIEIKTKKDFNKAIRKIKLEVQNGVLPYIHVECHGNEKGLELYSKASINWPELIHHFTDINILSRNSLFVSFAACEAAHILFYIYNQFAQKMSSKTIRSPFWGFVAPKNKINYGELNSYDSFFKEFIESVLDESKAFDIKSTLDNVFGNDQFIYFYCEFFIQFTLDRFLESQVKPILTNEIQFSQHLIELSQKFNKNKGVLGISLQEIKKLEQLISNKKTYIEPFNQIIEVFLMTDLYPELKERFSHIVDITNWKIQTSNE